MAKKNKKKAVAKPAQSKKSKPVPAKRQARDVKSSGVSKRLINKVVKKIGSRKPKHTDAWIKKQAQASPAPSNKKSSTGKRKLKDLKYKGKKLSPELQERIRQIRADFVKQGKFLTNKLVIRKYFEIEEMLLHSKEVSDENDPLKIKKTVSQSLESNFYELNGVINVLFDIKNEYGKFTISVIGFGEKTPTDFKKFGEGLRKVDQELSIIWEAFEIYRIKYGLNSPLFKVPLIWDENVRIAFIDFNKTIFMSVDIDKLIQIIINIKNNLYGDMITNLSPDQIEEMEKEEKKEITSSQDQPKNKTTKKKSKKSKPQKINKKNKVPNKKSISKVKQKKSSKNKPVYPKKKDGTVDLRYKQNYRFKKGRNRKK